MRYAAEINVDIVGYVICNRRLFIDHSAIRYATEKLKYNLFMNDPFFHIIYVIYNKNNIDLMAMCYAT